MMIVKIECMKFYDGTSKVGMKRSNPDFSVYADKEEDDDKTKVVIYNRKTDEQETFLFDVENMNLPDVQIKELFGEQFALLFYYSDESIVRIMDMRNSEN